MKKLILCATALFFGTMAFAQISGAPEAQVVTPLAGTGGHMNAGESVQNGDDNAVRVRQAGTENSVYTEQDNGTGLGGNLARIRQTGNVTGISGFQNAAEVNQSGTANQATIGTGGDLNNVIINQGQNNDASANNKAKVKQGGQHAESNYAAIVQDGDNNQAQGSQGWDNNSMYTIQDGDDNKSMVVQSGGVQGSDGHEALTYQLGEYNESSISQSGAGATNRALANQIGDNNKSKQLQVTTAGIGMTGNQGSVYQGYVGDVIGGPQDYPLFFSVLVDQVLPLDNFAGPIVANNSSHAVAFQTQVGKEQRANIDQYGGSEDAYNYGEQEQASGWGNDAYMLQVQEGSKGNYAKQYQAGDNNEAGLAQYGSGHKSSQSQIGHRNNSMAMQQGEDNLLNTHQRGNDNYATSAQRGIANATLIVQYGGNSYVAQQNLDGLGGGGNQIDALQLGPNGNFYNDAIECGFDDQMDPWMDYTVPGFELDPICPDC